MANVRTLAGTLGVTVDEMQLLNSAGQAIRSNKPMRQGGSPA
jgi:hypothetical protein